MANYYCKWCGYKSSRILSLTSLSCSKIQKEKNTLCMTEVKNLNTLVNIVVINLQFGETTFDIFNPKFI